MKNAKLTWCVLCVTLSFASTIVWAATSRPAGGSPFAPVPARVLSDGPNGYELAAYIDCGPTRMAIGEGGSLRQLQGESYTWPEARAQDALGSVAFDQNEVIYEAQGLRPENDYVLGFTWWDFDQQKRVQSVRFGTGEPVEWTTVLPPAPAVAWDTDRPSYVQAFLPITEQYRKAGSLKIGFKREGPVNAVVSEVWLLCKPRPDKAQTPRRVLIVTGDDFPGHVWRQTAPELASIMRADPRLEVTITETPAILASPLMGHYDVAVLHYMNWNPRPDPGEAVWKGLQQYVESGKGLVIVHFACGAFGSWGDFGKLAGRIYVPRQPPHDPYGAFEVRPTAAAHPITAGMSAFKTVDELYICLGGDTPIHVLAEATATTDGKTYPMAFVLEVGKGRVFHSPLGHGLESLRCPGQRDLFRRAAAWAAGLEVR